MSAKPESLFEPGRLIAKMNMEITLMSAANERLNAILIDLPAKRSQWEKNVVNPYVRAYDMAYDSYQKTLTAQAAHDRMVAELFVLAASVLSGSVMMAAFASSSLRVLAGRAMLKAICNNNLNRTFNAVHAISNSETAMFALGGLLDAAKNLAGKQIQSAMEDLTKSPPIAASPSALNFLTRMVDFIDANHIALHGFVRGVIDDASISDDNKVKIAQLVAQTPFWNAPTSRRVDETSLSQKMELLFYMQAVMDSDFLVQYAPIISASSLGGTGAEAIYSRKSIAQSPAAPDYPKETLPKLHGGLLPYFEPGQRIQYDRLGSVVEERVNKVSQFVLGSPFFAETGIFDYIKGSSANDSKNIVKAEQIINRLAMAARPKNYNDVLYL